jgi:imidazolonepropionase-like amidohydrolase
LNLVDELRLLRKIAPEASSELLWSLVTINAARALSMDDEVGSVSVGKRADFAVFPAEGDDPLESILREPILPVSLWIDGERVQAATDV